MRDSLDIAAPAPIASLDRVSVRLGAATLLDDITLAVQSGPPTALIGPNGSGKTTLLRAIMGLLEPTSGRIALAEVERAIVLQKPVMLRRSVAANVTFALKAVGRDGRDGSVARLLELVGLAALAERPARKLSGGEHQRLAIARALAREPKLLLLDEATASLDPAQSKIIEDLIQRVAQSGVKVIFATHELGQARRLAGDVVLLVRGRVAEHARSDAFFTNPSSEAGRRFIAGDLVL